MNQKQEPVSNSSENNVEEQARQQLNAGNYSEAIALYKKLLQDCNKGEWNQQLAFCYLQRALAFANRGMFKKAVLLWEDYTRHAQPPYENLDNYISWQIQSNNRAGAQTSLGQLTAQQLDKEYPALSALLGFIILTGHPEYKQILPQHSTFITHLEIVEAALQAYRDDNPTGIDVALKKLPYRSAFRDFRTLLIAVMAISNSYEETQRLLAKIPANSPYSKAAALLLACTRKGTALAQEMLQFNPQQRRIIGDIKGLDKKQRELIDTLSKQKEHLTDKIKFNLAIQYQSLCSSDLTKQFCFAILATYPNGKRDFKKNFGSINEFEINRLKALASENNSYDAEFYWLECIKALTKDESNDNALKIALILRHIAAQQEHSAQTELLIESLDYDSDDKDSYLKILQNYGQNAETGSDYKQWLNTTIAKFPQDIDVLSLAIQSALNSKAYKKAAQYASTILKIDPLNSFAKKVIFSSHLAHAGKLLRDKKYSLIEKAIQQAEAMKTSAASLFQVQLKRGLLCFATQDKQKGLHLIAEALTQLNKDPVNMHFQAAMEALLTGLPVSTVIRGLPDAKEHLLTTQELTRFIQQLTQYSQNKNDQKLLHKALEKVKAPLKQSILQQDYDENLMLLLCQALDAIQHFELLRHCAKRGQIKWQKPIWMYYWIYSETNNNPERCSSMHGLSLQDSLNRARQEKDHKASMLLGNFLDRYHDAHTMRSTGFLNNLFETGVPDESDDPFEQLFGHLPDEIFFKLDKKIESLVKQTTPDKLVQDLHQITGQNNNIFLAIMQNPDLFTALMFLRAAEDLKINIDVSVKDILACFGVEAKPGSFPI